MKRNETLESPQRRAFFRKAGAGVGAAGAAAVGLSAPSGQAGVKSDKDFKQGAYRETEHVKKAYDTARY